MRYLLLPVAAMILAACGIRDAVPEEADRELLWIIGLSFAFLCIGGGLWLIEGTLSRMARRRDRRDDRGRDE